MSAMREWDLLFPLKLSCIFRWKMTKATLCKKTNMNHLSRKPSVFLFLCHARWHCHVGVSNGGKRKKSVKLLFSKEYWENVHQNHSPFEGTKQLSYQFSLYASVTGTGSKTPIVSYHFTVGPTTFFWRHATSLITLIFLFTQSIWKWIPKSNKWKEKKNHLLLFRAFFSPLFYFFNKMKSKQNLFLYFSTR